MPCPFSQEISCAVHLRKCSIDDVSCGEKAWRDEYLNCPEYKHQQNIKKVST